MTGFLIILFSIVLIGDIFQPLFSLSYRPYTYGVSLYPHRLFWKPCAATNKVRPFITINTGTLVVVRVYKCIIVGHIFIVLPENV